MCVCSSSCKCFAIQMLSHSSWLGRLKQSLYNQPSDVHNHAERSLTLTPIAGFKEHPGTTLSLNDTCLTTPHCLETYSRRKAVIKSEHTPCPSGITWRPSSLQSCHFSHPLDQALGVCIGQTLPKSQSLMIFTITHADIEAVRGGLFELSSTKSSNPMEYGPTYSVFSFLPMDER